MEIIKQGKMPDLECVKLFKCPICGSVFKASKREYDYSEPEDIPPYYKCTCPICAYIVRVEED